MWKIYAKHKTKFFRYFWTDSTINSITVQREFNKVLSMHCIEAMLCVRVTEEEFNKASAYDTRIQKIKNRLCRYK